MLYTGRFANSQNVGESPLSVNLGSDETKHWAGMLGYARILQVQSHVLDILCQVSNSLFNYFGCE